MFTQLLNPFPEFGEEFHSSTNAMKGMTDNYERLRQQMVRDQLLERDITDRLVLAAMGEVPREEFVPSERRTLAYEDGALPIGDGQTISQPYTVAYMCQLAQPKPTDRVLEIGTGSGYGAAVLSRIVQSVHTIERIPELAHRAATVIESIGYKNITVHTCDGTLGLSEHAPFDAIIVTAGGNQIPQPYLKQLADGGRLVMPVGIAERSQNMIRVTRVGDRFEEEDCGRFVFVPLIGEYGWKE